MHSNFFFTKRNYKNVLLIGGSRAGSDLKDRMFGVSHDTETRYPDDHSGWRSFSDGFDRVRAGHGQMHWIQDLMSVSPIFFDPVLRMT